jgi:hypothetical protein
LCFATIDLLSRFSLEFRTPQYEEGIEDFIWYLAQIISSSSAIFPPPYLRRHISALVLPVLLSKRGSKFYAFVKKEKEGKKKNNKGKKNNKKTIWVDITESQAQQPPPLPTRISKRKMPV